MDAGRSGVLMCDHDGGYLTLYGWGYLFCPFCLLCRALIATQLAATLPVTTTASCLMGGV